MKILEETREHIKKVGKKVAWIGSLDMEYAMTEEEFFDIIEEFDYDGGYGSAEIAGDLVIVYEDGSHSDRREYDGSEWWEHHSLMPVKIPEKAKKFNKIKGEIRKGGWK